MKNVDVNTNPYFVKWQSFINNRIDETFASKNYHLGETLGAYIDSAEEYPIYVNGIKPTSSEIFDTRKRRAKSTLTQHFFYPKSETELEFLTTLFTGHFNHDSFKYIQCLLVLFDEIVNGYSLEFSSKQLNSIMFSYLKLLIEDPNFLKLPIEWKLEMAERSGVENES